MRGFLAIVLFLALILEVLPMSRAVAASVQITSVNDFNLPAWALGDPAVSASIDVCIYSLLNSPGGSYAVTATSSTGAFTIANGVHTIPYSLYWDDGGLGNLGSSNGTQLSYGVKLTGRANANQVVPLCLTGPTARLNLKITQAAMTAALSGTYNGTVTLLISVN